MNMHGTATHKKKSARSAITNGSRLFARHVDLRTSRGARFKDLIAAYTHDAGNDLTEAQRAIVRDLAMLQVLAEDLQQSYMETGSMSQEEQTQYARITNNMRRHMKTLGLTTQRDDKPDDIPDPLEYAKRGRRARLDADEEEAGLLPGHQVSRIHRSRRRLRQGQLHVGHRPRA